MANVLGVKKVAVLRPPKPCMPKLERAPKPAKLPARTEAPAAVTPPRRGPAYLDGPAITTEHTRYTVYPTPPRALRTNTHSAY